MDYEKKYNEALERAKAYHRNELAGSRREMTEYIFPELRDSKDEKVRALLVSLVQWAEIFPQSGLDSDTTNKMLSYLEKQKEQNPNYCHHEVDETGWTEEYRKAYYDGWNNCNMQHEQLKANQKPAGWSEEDEKKIHFLSRLIEFQVKDGEYCFGEGACAISKQEAIEMLQSLRPSWKPSDEHLSALLAVFNDPNNIGSQTCQLALTDLYEQLKKL